MTQFNPNSYLALVSVGDREFPTSEARDRKMYQLALSTRLCPTTRDIKILYERGTNRKDVAVWYLAALLANNNFVSAGAPQSLKNLEDTLRNIKREFKPNKATIILANQRNVEEALKRLGLEDFTLEEFTGYQFVSEIIEGKKPSYGYSLKLPYSKGNIGFGKVTFKSD